MKSNDNTITKIIKDTVNETIIELKNSNMFKNEMSYYKRIELLLYNYENLKDAVKQKEEDIEYIKKYGLPETSKSIVIYSSNNFNTDQDRYVELMEKYKREKIEIERDIERIDNALNKIKNDKYYDIIKLKYLNNEEDKVNTDEELAERLKKDRSTITRNRKRLVNRLVTIIFPSNIKGLI